MELVPAFVGDTDASQWLCATAVLFANVYNYRFMHAIGLYNSIMSWQLTIFSLHVAPIVTIRCLGFLRWIELTACTAWILFAWCLRRRQRSLWSLFFLVLESIVATCTLLPEFLDALTVLQAVVIAGFWSGVGIASCSRDFTFLPLDRHLRLGFSHVARSPKARRCLLHEMVGHFLSQAAFAGLMLLRFSHWPHFPTILPLVVQLVAAYILCVVLVAAVVPPHEMPYNVGCVPACLRWPLAMPAWLVGEGAVVRLDKLALPWWMKLEEEGGASECKRQ